MSHSYDRPECEPQRAFYLRFPCSRAVALTLLLALPFVMSSCMERFLGQGAEGLRVMTGRGGTKEKRDVVGEIRPIARDLQAYQPRPRWQTTFRADAADILTFVSEDRILLGTVQLSSAIADPAFAELALLDARTGTLLWTLPREDLDGGTYSVISVSPRILVRGDAAKQSTYTAIDPKSGSIVWARKVPREHGVALDASMALLIFHLRDAPGNRIEAVGLSRGVTRWSVALSAAPPPQPAPSRMLLNGERLTLGAGESVSRIDTERATLAWSTRLDRGEIRRLNVSYQGLLVGAKDGLALLDPATGTVRWSVPLESGELLSVIAAGGAAVAHSRKSGASSTGPGRWVDTLAGFDLNDGHVLWRRQYSAHEFPNGFALSETIRSPLIYTDSAVSFTTTLAYQSVEPSSGQVRVHAALPAASISTTELPDVVTLRGKTFVVARDQIGVVAIDRSTGHVAWFQKPGGSNANLWYGTRLDQMQRAELLVGALGSKRTQETRQWSDWIGGVEANAVQNARKSSGDFTTRDIGSVQSSALFMYSAMALSKGIRLSIMSAAQRVLAERKLLEIQFSRNTHIRSLQNGFFVGPYASAGDGAMLVSLDTGERADFQFAAPSYGAQVYGVYMPQIALSPSGNRVAVTGIGLEPEQWERYVKFSWGMPYPSVMMFDVDQLEFHRTLWNNEWLATAASKGNTKKVVSLLKDGASPDSRDSPGDWPALTEAAFYGHLEAVRVLLDAGANPKIRTVRKYYGCCVTAIQAAADNGYVAIVKLLLDAGADPSGSLALARERKKNDVVTLLEAFEEAESK